MAIGGHGSGCGEASAAPPPPARNAGSGRRRRGCGAHDDSLRPNKALQKQGRQHVTPPRSRIGQTTTIVMMVDRRVGCQTFVTTLLGSASLPFTAAITFHTDFTPRDNPNFIPSPHNRSSMAKILLTTVPVCKIYIPVRFYTVRYLVGVSRLGTVNPTYRMSTAQTSQDRDGTYRHSTDVFSKFETFKTRSKSVNLQYFQKCSENLYPSKAGCKEPARKHFWKVRCMWL